MATKRVANSVGRPRELPVGSKKFQVLLTPEIIEPLLVLAAKSRWSPSATIRFVLEDYLLRGKKKP